MPIRPLDYARVWPLDRLPLVLFGIHGDRTVLATAFRQVKPDDFWKLRYSDLITHESPTPKWIGVLAYDEFSPAADRREACLIYEISECLIWERDSDKPVFVSSKNNSSLPWTISPKEQDQLKELALKTPAPESKPWTLKSELSDDTYIALVHEVLSRINAGTFYQLNLLRWFQLQTKITWPELCSKLEAHGGPMSCLFRHGRQIIASMSPERFISIHPTSEDQWLRAWPIKGTAPRFPKDSERDALSGDTLLGSKKDLAELHMIVDLMRNDLFKVCIPQTVTVPVPHALLGFEHVYHLQALIEGKLDTSLTVKEILTAVCPGGSITGAPKNEVMTHIRRLEGQDRGFMMGHAFVINTDGSMDSNVLIRTLTSKDHGTSWRYAAGSGLVIKSDPQQEAAEIAVKCRPVTT